MPRGSQAVGDLWRLARRGALDVYTHERRGARVVILAWTRLSLFDGAVVCLRHDALNSADLRRLHAEHVARRIAALGSGFDSLIRVVVGVALACLVVDAVMSGASSGHMLRGLLLRLPLPLMLAPVVRLLLPWVFWRRLGRLLKLSAAPREAAMGDAMH